MEGERKGKPTVGAGRRLLGGILAAAGVLIGGLSGLCTAGFLFFGVRNLLTWPSRTALQAYDALSVPLLVGGLPWGLGGAAVVLSGPVAGAPPRRRLAWIALGVAIFILAGTAPDAAAVIIHGPDKPTLGFLESINARSDWFVPSRAALGGLVLLAAALYELRRPRRA